MFVNPLKIATALLLLLFCAPIMAQLPTTAPTPAPAPTVARPAGEKASQAELITSLKQSLTKDLAELQRIRKTIEDPESSFAMAERDFNLLNQDLEARRKILGQSRVDKVENLQQIENDFKDLEKIWKLAKDRYDLEIEARKNMMAAITSIERKMAKDIEVLLKMGGTLPDGVSPPPTPTPAVTPATATPTPPTGAAPADPAAAGSSGDAAPVPNPALMAAGIPPQASTATATPSAVTPTPTPTPVNRSLQKAEKEATRRAEIAAVAQQEVESIEERFQVLRERIEIERRGLQNLRKQSDNAIATHRALKDEYTDRLENNTLSSGEKKELRARIEEADKRFLDARAKIVETTDLLNNLQSEMALLQEQRIAALSQAEQSRLAAETAQKRVETLRNPLHPENIKLWFISHGPRVVLIIAIMAAILFASNIFIGRIIGFLVNSSLHGKEEEKKNRADTLVGVVYNFVRLITYAWGIIMLLDAVGFPIAALLGGAAIGGLAVAFGAQNLIRDYFTGFVILLENQYTVNDVIRISDISGSVERITLRATVLRDIEGTVHFIPNGEIKTVSNMTHGWSRALINVGIAYKEDVDVVIAMIREIGFELRHSEAFGMDILEDLTMLGVDSMADSAVVIRFFIKTKPLKQWAVKREMLRRIKKRFDEAGIEIPFPQRTVHHRYDEPVKDKSGIVSPEISMAGGAD
jgi:small conductance mechanosensitive channel